MSSLSYAVVLTMQLGSQAAAAVAVSATSSTPATSTPAPVVCPAANGTQFTSGSTTFTVECGFDRYDSDLSMVYTYTFNDCMAKCAANSACVDVSWVPGNAGPCYMKSGIGAVQYNAGVWGARSTSATSSLACPAGNGTSYSTTSGKSFTVECDIDHFDSDFASNPIYVADLKSCIAACDAKTGCQDVVLSGTACYLKSSVGPTIYRAGSGLSGAKCASGCPTYVTQPTCSANDGAYYASSGQNSYKVACSATGTGNSISVSTSYTSFAACINSCDTGNGCKAVTWDSNASRCILHQGSTGYNVGQASNYWFAFRTN